MHTSRSLSSTLCSTANSFPGPGAQPLIPKLQRSSCLFDSRHHASRWVSTKHPHPSFLLSIIALCSLGDPRAHWYQKYKMIKAATWPGKAKSQGNKLGHPNWACGQAGQGGQKLLSREEGHPPGWATGGTEGCEERRTPLSPSEQIFRSLLL